MSQPHIFDPPNRLARVLVETGGPTHGDAVERADAQLAEILPRLRRTLDLDVSQLLEMQALSDEAKRGMSAKLGQIALRIAEVAAAVGAPQTGEAARGVYAMVEAYHAEGLWRADALDLHLSAISLFEGAVRLPDSAAVNLLRQLAEMRAAVGVQD